MIPVEKGRRRMARHAIAFRRSAALAFLLCLPLAVGVSQQASLAGRVIDAMTHQPVAHAGVLLVETGQRTFSDASGNFSVACAVPGRYTLHIHHVAYGSVQRVVMPASFGQELTFALEPALLQSDEMVVQCTRAPSLLNATPYPLNVETRDHLLGSHAVTVADALKHIPGLALVRDGSWETAIAIRGMSRSNIVTVIDDARIETASDIAGPLALINLHDLEQAEVLKSPASAHHGTGAIGGLVHLVSKRPAFAEDFRLSGECAVDISSVDGGVARFGAIEAAAERYAFRLSGGVRSAGNTRTAEGVLEGSQFHDFSISGVLGVSIGGGQSVVMTYQRVQAEDAGIPGGAPFARSAVATYTLARRELVGCEYRMPNLSPVVPLLTMRVHRQEIARDVDIRQANLTEITPHAVHTTWGGEVEARLVPFPDLLIAAGAEVWQRELDSERERRTATVITGERPVPVSRFLSAGLFVHNEWSIVPGRFTATCGARYDRIRVTNDEVLNPLYVITGGVPDTQPENQRLLWRSAAAQDGSWSAQAGLRYAASSFLDLTALVSAAFRSPSLEERFEFIDLGNIVYVGNPDLQSEESASLNAGLRLQMADLRVEGDVFVNSMSNLVGQMPSSYEGREAFIRTNVGSARLYGFEIDVRQSLAGWCVVSASGSYVRGEDTFGRRNLPQIPPFNGQVELKGILDNAGMVTLSIPWALAQGNPGPGEVRTPGYAILDAGIAGGPWAVGWADLSLRAEVRNLFDKGFRNHLSTLRGVVRCEPGRNFVLSATMDF